MKITTILRCLRMAYFNSNTVLRVVYRIMYLSNGHFTWIHFMIIVRLTIDSGAIANPIRMFTVHHLDVRVYFNMLTRLTAHTNSW